MPYTPQLHPILVGAQGISAEFFYEKRYTAKNDVTHDAEHLHDFYEIYVNLSGDVSFLVEDTLYPIRRGDIVVTRPNELHKCIYHSDGIHEHFCIWLNALPAESEYLHREFHKQTLVVLSREDKTRLIELCFDLHRIEPTDEMQRFRAAARFFEVLDIICANRQSVPVSQDLPKSFSEIVDYITTHYSEPSCTVSLLCENFYISKSTLCRLFRRYFQLSPSDYIESKRFSEAKKKLVAGLSVQDACFGCGFSDCSYFILRFRKKFGMTPYRFQREQLRAQGSASEAR